MQDFSFLTAPADLAEARPASWAEQMCADADMDVAPVLSQQFLLAPSGTPAPGAMRGVAIGDRVLYHGANLPVACAPLGRGRIALLGLAVDPEGVVLTTARLTALAARAQEPLAFLDWLADSAGRFAIIVHAGPIQRIYLDAIGSLGVVYDPETRRIGSTTNLVLTRAPEPDESFAPTADALIGAGRFAFGRTPDARVTRVLPNHFLDLKLLTQVRHWPGPDDLNEPSAQDEADVVRGIVTRFEQVIASLADHLPGNVHLPMSGGLDSRILLACAKPVIDDLRLFTHAENSMSRKDMRIATHLARRVGSDIERIDPIRDDTYRIESKSRLAHLTRLHQVITGLKDEPHAIRHEVLLAHAPGGIYLRGNGIDFLKAVLWRRGVNEYITGADHDIRTGLRMMMLGEKSLVNDPALQGLYEDWYASLPGSSRARAYDLMFAEHFLSHGFGNLLYGFINNFYICPFNDRRLLAAASSLPPDKRARLHYNLAITDWRAPELGTLHYARRAVNQHVKTMRAEGEEILSLA